MNQNDEANPSPVPVTASADLGTPERIRHAASYAVETTEDAGVFVARTLDTHVLDRLVLKESITPEQRDAGLLFFRDYQTAIKESRLCSSYNSVRTPFSVFGDWDVRTPEEEKAYARWRKAMTFLRGRLGDLVVSAICYERPLSRMDLRELRCGLTVLVNVYESNKKVDQAAARDVGSAPTGDQGSG